MDNDRAREVVSNATYKPANSPCMACSMFVASNFGSRSPNARVIPTTVPKKPSIGVAQMTMRTRP